MKNLADLTRDQIERDLIALDRGIGALRETLDRLIYSVNIAQNAEAIEAMVARRESR